MLTPPLPFGGGAATLKLTGAPHTQAIEKGRVIYAGIQKFVSFIMSVHLAEVLQIFLCIVSSVPVMRQPLQILFLILVTDLPPSIALGFEPGEALTMKRKPRPKSQPVVQMWMWRGIVANGIILTVCIFGTYLLALWAYAGAFTTEDITNPGRDTCTIWDKTNWTPTVTFDCKLDARCEACIDKSIRRARTCAFISLVWAEAFRAYCSRSFENGVWVQTWSNPSMNKAVAMAQVTLGLALFIPGLNQDVLGLYVYEIQGFGWFLAFVGAFACLVFCELYKHFTSRFVQQEALAECEEEEAAGNKPAAAVRIDA